jgi:hypothetical protein
MATSPHLAPLAVGTRVLVRCVFDGRWVSGFVVSAVTTDREPLVRVTRTSDGSELPHVFTLGDVRPDP